MKRLEFPAWQEERLKDYRITANLRNCIIETIGGPVGYIECDDNDARTIAVMIALLGSEPPP